MGAERLQVNPEVQWGRVRGDRDGGEELGVDQQQMFYAIQGTNVSCLPPAPLPPVLCCSRHLKVPDRGLHESATVKRDWRDASSPSWEILSLESCLDVLFPSTQQRTSCTCDLTKEGEWARSTT